MKSLFNFFIFLFLILKFSFLHAENNIAYIDLDAVMNNSTIGKALITSIEKKGNEISKKFEKKANKLKEEEIQIISQKNLLKKENYEKKVADFSKKIDEFKKEKNIAIEQLNLERVETTQLLLEKIKPILAQHSEENGIILVLQKQNIVIGKSDLDITEQILLIVNQKLKKLN